MSVIQIIGSIAGVFGALGFGAIGGYLFYKRKHPSDLEGDQVSNIKAWQEVYPSLVEDVQRIADQRVEQVKKEFNERLDEQQRTERIDCDEKIDQLRSDFRKTTNELKRKADEAEKQAEKNNRILQSAKDRCPDGCFSNTNAA